jgi:dTDP-4-dehydrorhamnose 3,5-epimerase
VAHGFLCSEAGMQFYGMTHGWDAGDDLLCRWDDPHLGFRLPVENPVLSERDASAGSLAAMTEAYLRLARA